MQVICQRAGQLHQQRIIRAETITGNSVHQTFEVSVSIAVEPNLFGPFLWRERLQGSGPVVAAVGTVGGAGNQAAAPGAGARSSTAASGVISLGPGRASPTNLVSFVKMLQLEGLTERHCESGPEVFNRVLAT